MLIYIYIYLRFYIVLEEKKIMQNKIIGYKLASLIKDLHSVTQEDMKIGEPIYLLSEEGEEILRHSAAHILGEVILSKYINVNFAVGPVTEHGFYYDILMDNTISSLDLEEIEKRMKDIINKKIPFEKKIVSLQEAKELFSDDICKKIILEQIANSDEISIYKQGGFLDLCKGPHVQNTEDVSIYFKLTRVSQVQWKDKLLQRVEGKLFYSKERLIKHLELIKKQESIDHRKLGEEMEFFKQLPVSQGNMFWLPKGAYVFHLIKEYLVSKYEKYNYNVVQTPLIFNNQLWKDTGHWDKYMENMYITQNDMVVKPMNCPGHVEVFKIGNYSYKDLPYRIGEICHVHRKEETGALNGLKRATGFHQDDGHIFCTINQMEKEITYFYDMLQEIYADFGFNKYRMILSTRPEKYIGSIELWDKAEEILKNWLDKSGISYTVGEGDGAFYGPKLEVQLEDNFIRHWTCGTFQVDFFLPERLKASYMSEGNSKEAPIMCHRAILGSLERFIALLMENYEGHLPLWIMPITVVVMSISEKTSNYANKVYKQLKRKNIRVELDISNNTLNSKLKKNLITKTPFIIIVGEEESQTNTITVREKNQNTRMTLREFIDDKLRGIYTPISRR